MILWVTSIFFLFLRIKFYSIKKFIHLGSSVLIPVYALHIIVICEFQKLSIFYSQYMQIVAYFLIFGICVFIGWIMNKIGYLKFLTRI